MISEGPVPDAPSSPAGIAPDDAKCYAQRVDPLICQCCAVYRSEIEAAIRDGANTVSEVGDVCDAGTGCLSCRDDIKQMLRDHAARQLAKQQAPTPLHQLSLFDEVAGRKNRGPGGAHGR